MLFYYIICCMGLGALYDTLITNLFNSDNIVYIIIKMLISFSFTIFLLNDYIKNNE